MTGAFPCSETLSSKVKETHMKILVRLGAVTLALAGLLVGASASASASAAA